MLFYIIFLSLLGFIEDLDRRDYSTISTRRAKTLEEQGIKFQLVTRALDIYLSLLSTNVKEKKKKKKHMVKKNLVSFLLVWTPFVVSSFFFYVLISSFIFFNKSLASHLREKKAQSTKLRWLGQLQTLWKN